MKLADLAREVDAVATSGRLDREARDVTHDSRAVAPGSVFVAIRGAKTDAHRFIFPNPALATNLSRICLRIEGTQTLLSGE